MAKEEKLLTVRSKLNDRDFDDAFESNGANPWRRKTAALRLFATCRSGFLRS